MKIAKDSQTYKNLQKAFSGEAEAYTKYQYYASQAKKDGYVQIKDIFEETAGNEKEHGKIWFKLLKEGMTDTLDNLLDGIAGEHYEASDMYINFYKEAKEEGYNEVAELFLKVAKIEDAHCKRYEVLADNVRKNNVFHKEDKISWICSNCGHVYVGRNAPAQCPVCQHPQSYFHEQLFNYL